jgi:hypothetical protein
MIAYFRIDANYLLNFLVLDAESSIFQAHIIITSDNLVLVDYLELGNFHQT